MLSSIIQIKPIVPWLFQKVKRQNFLNIPQNCFHEVCRFLVLFALTRPLAPLDNCCFGCALSSGVYWESQVSSFTVLQRNASKSSLSHFKFPLKTLLLPAANLGMMVFVLMKQNVQMFKCNKIQ